MAEAVNKANKSNADLFVSNHVNAGKGVGFETFYSRKSTSTNVAKAKIIHKHLVKTKSCLMDRRCCSDYSFLGFDLYVLINTKMDAILCEIGFVDNKECVKAVNDDEVAKAYASGIAEAYGLKKKAIAVPKSSSTSSDSIYRVIVDGVQRGAFKDIENALELCKKYVATAKEVKIQKV